MSFRRARHHEQARRVAIEPMDDSGALRLVAAGRVADETVNERATGMARGRVNDETGRFVDHEQVLVLVRHAKVELLPLERLLGSRRSVDLEFLAAGQLVALPARLARDAHGAGREQPLGGRARADLGQGREKAVQPLPRCFLRDLAPKRGYRLSCRRGPIKVASSTATPTTMNVSARLNAGQ